MIDKKSVIYLSDEASKQFIELLENPPKPNKKLIELFSKNTRNENGSKNTHKT
jgi:uncharacterized protein (DUF1778 family)